MDSVKNRSRFVGNKNLPFEILTSIFFFYYDHMCYIVYGSQFSNTTNGYKTLVFYLPRRVRLRIYILVHMFRYIAIQKTTF